MEKEYEDDEGEAVVKRDGLVWSECMFAPWGACIKEIALPSVLGLFATLYFLFNYVIFHIVGIITITRTMLRRHDLQFCKKR